MKRAFVLLYSTVILVVLAVYSLSAQRIFTLWNCILTWIPSGNGEYLSFSFAGFMNVNVCEKLPGFTVKAFPTLYDEERASLDYRTSMFRMCYLTDHYVYTMESTREQEP